MVRACPDDTPVAAMVVSATNDPVDPSGKYTQNLLNTPGGADLNRQALMDEDLPQTNQRSVFDWFAKESPSVMKVAGILVLGIFILKLVAYKSSPSMTSVLNYISAIGQ